MYAVICMQRFHWPPSVYAAMEDNEKAFVMAALDRLIKAEKEK